MKINFFRVTILENEQGNWLVHIFDTQEIFYMSPKGTYLPTAKERNESTGFNQDFWKYALGKMKLISLKPTGNQAKLIEHAHKERKRLSKKGFLHTNPHKKTHAPTLGDLEALQRLSTHHPRKG